VDDLFAEGGDDSNARQFDEGCEAD
jgi:hypothetical protein